MKTRPAKSTPLDTPCPTATIFELCKTTNDASFHKKRKTKVKDEEGGGEAAAPAGGADRVAAAMKAAERAARLNNALNRNR